ncbi:hypothetical protein [Thalassobacillus sp. CUG 92003]|uniref:hypothetical protein n=1 Tax=Thalassobacillus sp. CUG 92003 TaxID=2736641 RepID=UPI0015E68781|nr:hypothetical protein [Thalassobacillus sp. CUG 92003]
MYRSKEDGEFEHVASISAHERKSYTDEQADKHTYYVTTVSENGQESQPSSKTTTN